MLIIDLKTNRLVALCPECQILPMSEPGELFVPARLHSSCPSLPPTSHPAVFPSPPSVISVFPSSSALLHFTSVTDI